MVHIPCVHCAHFCRKESCLPCTPLVSARSVRAAAAARVRRLVLDDPSADPESEDYGGALQRARGPDHRRDPRHSPHRRHPGRAHDPAGTGSRPHERGYTESAAGSRLRVDQPPRARRREVGRGSRRLLMPVGEKSTAKPRRASSRRASQRCRTPLWVSALRVQIRRRACRRGQGHRPEHRGRARRHRCPPMRCQK